MGEKPDFKGSALFVLRKRYLLRDRKGRVTESPDGMFRRVAREVAGAERVHDRKADPGAVEDDFFRAMQSLDFLPNSPTLMNAGAGTGQLSACFVLPVEDSVASIFDALKDMALIHKSGGGTGFSFSRLRPAGDLVSSSGGGASGPVSFIRIFDTATGIIKQGGRRRGANMGILGVSHPDIMDFVSAKRAYPLRNFNLSVGITDSFMEALGKGRSFPLVNPRNRRVTERVKAEEIFSGIVRNAWQRGDPGAVFLDEINRRHPLKGLGRIEGTNPCGEVPLLPYESCNLGSINLSHMVDGDRIDWKRLGRTARLGVRFLDNVIDMNRYPLVTIEEKTKAGRKIGLGVMGFAELLVRLGIPYSSERAVSTAERLMGFISREARGASRELARERGAFPQFGLSSLKTPQRNATVTAIAPTGTISMIAGTTSGIEPVFALAFQREIMGGRRFTEASPVLSSLAARTGLRTRELSRRISANRGSLRGIRGIPADVRELLATSLEIEPEQHVRVQSAFQKHTDNAVSKTVNLPARASKGDVRRVFELAYRLRCKGVTVYRSGSRKDQVLSTHRGRKP